MFRRAALLFALLLLGVFMSAAPALAEPGPGGALSANPVALRFAAIPYKQGHHEEGQNETEQVNILGAQEATVQIQAVSISGPDASSFSVQYGDCEFDFLSANNSCAVGIRFEPLSRGPKHAQLEIESDSPNSPLVVPLEGEGLLGPQISLSSKEAQLGNVLLGSSTQQTLTVTNSGDYPLFIQQSFLVSGTPLMFPLLSDTCSGQFVDPEASCAFTVGFQPTTPGEKDASIVFVTNATPQINVLGIDGVGVQPAAAAPQLSQGLAPQDTQALLALSAPRHEAVDLPHLLTFERTPRLYSSAGEAAVDTGVVAACPTKLGACRAESSITARIPTHPANATSQSSWHVSVLLGSETIRLHRDESQPVRIPLSHRAIALFREHGRLLVTIETVVRAGGTIVDKRARVVTLVAPTSAA
jgi:hypothetical protein